MEHREINGSSTVPSEQVQLFHFWDLTRLTAEINMSGYFTKLGYNIDIPRIQNERANTPPTTVTSNCPNSVQPVFNAKSSSDLDISEHVTFEKIRQNGSKKRTRPIEEFFETPPIGSLTPQSKERLRKSKRMRLLMPLDPNQYHTNSIHVQIDETLDLARRAIKKIIVKEDADIDSRGLNFSDFVGLTVAMGNVQTTLSDDKQVSNELTSICVQISAIERLEREDELFDSHIKDMIGKTINKLGSNFKEYMDSIGQLIKTWAPRNVLIATQLEILRSYKVNYAFLSLRSAEIQKRAASLTSLIATKDESGRLMMNYIDHNPAQFIDEIQKNIERHVSSASVLETILNTMNHNMCLGAAAIFNVPKTFKDIQQLEIFTLMTQFGTTPLIDKHHEFAQEYALVANRYSLWTLFAPIFKHKVAMIRSTLDSRKNIIARLCEGTESNCLSESERCRLNALLEVETDLGDLYCENLALIRAWFIDLWKAN